MSMRLIQGEALEVMGELVSEGVKVDAVITDPPYGNIRCKWDSVIPLEPMWEMMSKITKPKRAIALFGNEPFTSFLISSNVNWFKYRLDWDKVVPSGM